MSSISNIIAEVTLAAQADAKGDDPKAHHALLKSIQKLTLAAERPTETAKRILYQPPTNAALRVAVELGLLEAIDASTDGPISAQKLAKQRGIDEILVVRVMRALTAIGVCAEYGPGQYSPTPVTKEFADGLGDGVKALYELFIPAAAHVIQSIQQAGFRAPTQAKEAPFYFAQNTTMFEWLKENPEQKKSFDSYMGCRRNGMIPWFEIVPVARHFSTEIQLGRSSALLVDVGGSHGHDLIRFHERYADIPGLLVLQDLSETLQSISHPIPGIEMMVYDFFTPQPIKGARAYYFGAICHNFSDDDCIRFLSNTAKAMDRDYSTLFINDYVLPETGASVHSAAMDLQMMTFVAGMERTENQWKSLLDSSGLNIDKIWYSSTGFESVIECKLKD